MLTIWKYIRVLSKIFSLSSPTDIKTVSVCCHIANFTIPSFTTGNSVNSYLIFTADKTYHGHVITFFLCNFCSFICCIGGVQVSKLFTVIDGRKICNRNNIWRNNTQVGLLISIFICSDLLNWLRRVGTIILTAGSG